MRHKRKRNLKLDKRKRIREQFRRFVELCPDIPTGKAHIFEGSEYDPPDICIGDGELGIEFVDFLHGAKSNNGGSQQKQSEDFFDEVLQATKAQFEKRTNIGLTVFCHWRTYQIVEKLPKVALTSALTEIIVRSIPTDPTHQIVLGWDDLENTGLENVIAAVSLLRCESLLQAHWQNVHRGRVSVDANTLTRYIQSKEGDLPHYKKPCKATWLVIVAAGSSISSIAELDPRITSESVVSKFDKVYFLNMSNYHLDKPLICLTGEGN